MYLEDMFGLNGKVAVITGGARGIGQVVACALAKAGAKVAVLCRSGADETVRMIESEGGQGLSIVTDVSCEEQVAAACAEIIKQWGRIDVLFNNAAVCQHQPTLETSAEDFRRVVDINLTGEFIMAKAVANIMIEKGIHGSIINMASMSGSIVNLPQWQASYNASKAGVLHLTRSLAVELAPYGIRVNSLSPGYVATAGNLETPQELLDVWLAMTPMKRMAKPEEMVPAVLYLASSAAGFTTGSEVLVDGAYSCV